MYKALVDPEKLATVIEYLQRGGEITTEDGETYVWFYQPVTNEKEVCTVVLNGLAVKLDEKTTVSRMDMPVGRLFELVRNIPQEKYQSICQDLERLRNSK